jgi:hypothetical protein
MEAGKVVPTATFLMTSPWTWASTRVWEIKWLRSR